MNVYVGIDIGGSHVGLSLFDDTNLPLATHEEPLNPSISPKRLVARIVEIISELQQRLDHDVTICAAGMGSPGQCRDGVLVAASNFPAWGRNIPLAAMLSSALNNVTVSLVNDADAAIAAEVWGTKHYDGVKHAAIITLGTGIGLGLILNGRLHSGANGLIEGGHSIVHPTGGRSCGCGQSGCIEAHASAKNMSLIMEELAARNDQQDGLDVFDSKRGAKEVFQRAAAGNTDAQAVVDQVADDLAVFCLTLCRIVDPAVIVIGGGMSMAGEALLAPLRAALHRRTWTVLPTEVRITLAKQEGGQGGMLGAALAAKKLLEDGSHTHHHTGHGNRSGVSAVNYSSFGAHCNGILSCVLSAGLTTALYFSLVDRRTSTSNCSISDTPSSGSSGGRAGSCARYTPLLAHAALIGIHIAILSSWWKK